MALTSFQNAAQSINLDNKFLKHGVVNVRTAARRLTHWIMLSHAIKAVPQLLVILFQHVAIATAERAVRNGANGLIVKNPGLLIAY